jgi:electron transfer flavoprotein beta subunit
MSFLYVTLAFMKILVPIKRVVDFNVKIRVKSDGSGVETANIRMSMNPFDEIALEEAVRLKEKNIAAEVVAVSIGPDAVQETLRAGLAIGADRAIHIVLDGPVQPLTAAKLLAVVAREEKPGLIITGKQAIDDDAGQTGQMLAALLGWGQATFASKLEITGETAQVIREVDGGHQTLRLKLPAVVTTDLRLNEPRYPTLPNIMKARGKPIARKAAGDLGVDLTPRVAVLGYEEPARRSRGIRVKNAAELVDKLRNEAKVI